MSDFLEMMQLPFMQRALIVGIFISICCALLGVNLVLKNYAMLGDGLSHVGFGALPIGIAFGNRKSVFEGKRVDLGVRRIIKEA